MNRLHPGVAKLGIALGSGPRDRGFKSRHSDHVVADFVSFATTFLFKKSSLIHYVAPPFQIEPAVLGFDLVPLSLGIQIL